MIGLTARQTECLRFIEESIAAGVTPSFEEIAAHMGLKSRGRISAILDALERRGRITKQDRRARSIAIVQRRCPHCGHRLDRPSAARGSVQEQVARESDPRVLEGRS